jgi:hypothetical protein
MRGIPGGRVMKPVIIVTLILLAPAVLAAGDKHPSTYRIPLPPKPDFSSIEWMIGNWAGRMDRHSPQGEIHLSVAYDLDQRVMVFRENVSLAATGEIPANDESSIGILSRAPSGDSFLLQVFASTGFVSQYRVTVAGPEVDFTPDGGSQTPPGWLSRRIIQRGDVDGFTETVQMAPPLKPFFDYYSAAFTREPSPQKPATSRPGDHKKP